MRSRALFFPRIRSLLAPRVVPPLVAALLVFSFAGCLSTNVNVRSDGSVGAGILVRVYADPDAVKAQRTEPSGTLVELFSLDKRGTETFLQRSLAGEWGVSQLPPGRYRLRVVAILDDGGHIRETRSGDQVTDFSVKEGETAEVRVILKKTPTGLIVVAVVTVIILAVAIAVIAGKSGNAPPLPGQVLAHLPPPVLIRPIIYAPELWIGPVEGSLPRERSVPPRVTSVHPEPGSVVAARRVMPALTLSQPLDEAKLGDGTILMLGSRSGMVPGTTTVHRGLLRFDPSRDLLPGEDVTVTVRAGGVVNPDGVRLESDFSWSFRVAE